MSTTDDYSLADDPTAVLFEDEEAPDPVFVQLGRDIKPGTQRRRATDGDWMSYHPDVNNIPALASCIYMVCRAPSAPPTPKSDTARCPKCGASNSFRPHGREAEPRCVACGSGQSAPTTERVPWHTVVADQRKLTGTDTRVMGVAWRDLDEGGVRLCYIDEHEIEIAAVHDPVIGWDGSNMVEVLVDADRPADTEIAEGSAGAGTPAPGQTGATQPTGPSALPPGVVRDGNGWTLRAGAHVPEGWEWKTPNGLWLVANVGVAASFIRDVPIRPADTPEPTCPECPHSPEDHAQDGCACYGCGCRNNSDGAPAVPAEPTQWTVNLDGDLVAPDGTELSTISDTADYLNGSVAPDLPDPEVVFSWLIRNLGWDVDSPEHDAVSEVLDAIRALRATTEGEAS